MSKRFVPFAIAAGLVVGTLSSCSPGGDYSVSVKAPEKAGAAGASEAGGQPGGAPPGAGDPGKASEAPGGGGMGMAGPPKGGAWGGQPPVTDAPPGQGQGQPQPGPTGSGQPPQGQQPGRPRGMGGFGLGMLNNDAVRTELKITEGQKKKLEDLATSLRPPGEGDQRPSPEAIAERMKTARDGMEKILTNDQIARLEQIQLQSQGAMALLNTEVGSKLGLTEPQKKQLGDLQTKLQEKSRELFQRRNEGGQGQGAPGGGGPDRGRFQEFQKLRDDTNAKAMALLTPEQKAKWKEMTGKPFEFRPGPGGGPGGFRMRDGG